MLTAKTMTSNSENHNAQRIVIIPFHFRVSSPCKTYSCAKRRAGIPDGRPPANRYLHLPGWNIAGQPHPVSSRPAWARKFCWVISALALWMGGRQ
jgi:hypothetical protein